MTPPSIYDLKLHETLAFDGAVFFTTVLRVPGGWFYRSIDKSSRVATGCFVPYNLEFQPEEK